MDKKEFKSITAVLCTHNGSSRLINTLNQLVSQEYNKQDVYFELIVVDNASTDDTLEVASSFLQHYHKDLHYSILQQPLPGKANALEMGYNHAKGDLLLTVDDDNWLPNHFIQTAIDIFSSLPKDAGLLGSYGIPVLSQRPVPDIFIQNAASFACADFSDKSVQEDLGWSMGWAAGSVVPRYIWNAIYNAGFRFHNSKSVGKAYGEDSELFSMLRLLGYRSFIDKRCWFLHDLQRHNITAASIEQIRLLGGKAKVASFLIDDYRLQLGAAVSNPSFIGTVERLKKQWSKDPGQITLYSLFTAIKKRRWLASSAQVEWHKQSRANAAKELSEHLAEYERYFDMIQKIVGAHQQHGSQGG